MAGICCSAKIGDFPQIAQMPQKKNLRYLRNQQEKQKRSPKGALYS